MADSASSWDEDKKPSVLMVGDDPEGLREAVDAFAGAGFRADPLLSFSSASSGLPRGAAAMVIDATRASETDLDTTLAHALTATGNGRKRALLTLVKPQQIDAVAARLLGTAGVILCEPDAREWKMALGDVTGLRRRRTLHDHAGEQEEERARRLDDQVSRVAERIAQLGERSVADEPGAPADVTAAEIRAIIRARRLREEIFQGGLLSDPAWDMLLDLMASELEGRMVSTSTLCIASTAPQSTALRWIGILEKAGLVRRSPDPFDRRRVYVVLSANGRLGMSEYVRSIKRAGLPLV